MIGRKAVFVSAFYFCVLGICAAQTGEPARNFSFNHIGEKQGLNAEFISYMMKDSRGYLWLCSNPGLFRYDGINFKHFSFSFEDSTSISTNGANHIMEDRAGYLWVSTDLGLNRYDYRTGTFTRFLHNPNDTTSLPSNQVKRTALDTQGRVWAATNHGIALFVDSTQTFRSWTEFGDPSSPLRPFVSELIKDKVDANILWLSTDRGLFKFDMRSKTFHEIVPPADLIQQSNMIANVPAISFNRLYEDDEGILWIVNRYAKIFRFDKKNSSWKRFTLNETGRGGTTCIFPYDEDHLWLSGIYPGIKILDKRTGSVQSMDHDPNDASSPPTQVFHSFRDDEGIIWCSTNYQISKVDPYLQYFTRHKAEIFQGIGAALEVDRFVLMASNNAGVITLLDNQNYESSVIKIPVRFNPDEKINISQMIYLKSKNEIWIGTSTGLLVLDLTTREIKSIQEAYKLKTDHPVKLVTCLLIDSVGDIWIGHAYNGLLKYDSHESKLIDFTPNIQSGANSPQFLIIRDLKEDKNGVIWIATNSGLRLLDRSGKPLASDYVHNAGVMVNSYVISMGKDHTGNIWLSLKGVGMLEIKVHDGFATVGRSYNTTNGIGDNMVEKICFDDHDNLWATSHNGLIRIDLGSSKARNYFGSDGLVKNNFNLDILLSSTRGMYLFGHGVYFTFDGALFPKKLIPPPVYINSITLPLRDSVKNFFTGTAQSLTLKHNENYVSFRFCALNFSKPEENTFQYQLAGLQDYWVKRKADQNIATYTDLDPGTYTFHVKGANHDDVWNEKGASFEITILPPPWKSWWAESIYAVFLVGLSYWVWRRLVTRARLKTLATIKSAEAEKLREVDTMKSQFFANISHEFRTPLTLLLGPIEKRLNESQTPGDKAELGIMHRNASRLLTLVNQLLDLSRLEARTMKLRCSEADLQTSLLSITSQFSSIADSKQIGFEVFFIKSPSVYIDRDKFDTIVTNLLSNSFKFTPHGGHITLTVNEYPETTGFKEGCAEITVADTGPGISPGDMSKIFDRFFQADMSSTRAYEGTGIGLSLAKELIELHGGSISVTSSVGLGSVFTVCLPLGKGHLTAGQIESREREIQTKFVNDHGLPQPGQATDESRSLPHVLIVEDNADLRFYLRENLKQDFMLLEAEDGQAGISTALQEVPDIIISDLMMPKANGMELCEQLKADEKTSHIPIILLTAKADADTRLQGYKIGADDYIPKPFQIEELRVRLTSLMANRKRIQDKFAKHLSHSPTSVPATSMDERFLKRAMEVVEKFVGDSSFGVESFAQEMNVSHTQLYRKLQGITGLGPNEFVRHFRLSRAADLMRQRAGNVAEITYLVGFNNLSYFSKIFKEKFSVTPSEFLKNPQTKG